jgi:hypothetical protein
LTVKDGAIPYHDDGHRRCSAIVQSATLSKALAYPADLHWSAM